MRFLALYTLRAKPAKAHRKRRTKAEMQHAQDEHAMVAAMDLSDKRRHAVNSRWSKHRELAILAAADASDRELAIVAPPLHVADTDVVKLPNLSVDDLKPLAVETLSFNPALQSAKDYKLELDIFSSMSRLVSLSAIAECVKRDERSVRRTARLTTSMIVFSRKWRRLGLAQRLCHHLRTLGGDDFEPLQYLMKDKFDEVMLPVRMLEAIFRHDNKVVRGTKVAVKAKLMMLQTSHHYLRSDKSKYVSTRYKDATTMVPIEAATPECLLGARLQQLGDLTWEQSQFKLCGRIPVRDEHASNSFVRLWSLRTSAVVTSLRFLV